MGNYFSKLVDYERDLHIMFDIYPTINYENNSGNNLLEKNKRFTNYIQKKIQRSIHKLTNMTICIPKNQFRINCDVNVKENKIYYKIYMNIEFIIPNEYATPRAITHKLLEKTIMDRFTQNKINIKIDKNNFIYLTNGSIRNLEIYQPITV
jgi:hypothetical protein